MVSSSFLTIFSDLRIPKGRYASGYKDFLSLPQYCEYLNDYANKFKLRPHINLNTKVINVRRAKGGRGHVVTYVSKEGTEEWACDAVAVSSGLHVEPGLPTISGLDKVPEVFHSSQYKHKNREVFKEGSNVVILGCGETAMDMAYFAVTSPTKTVTLCSRNGFVLAPKVSSPS